MNTSYENIAYERGEVDKFLRANGGHLPQPMALAFFTDTGTQIQSTYTTDGNALSTSFDQYAIGSTERSPLFAIPGTRNALTFP